MFGDLTNARLRKNDQTPVGEKIIVILFNDFELRRGEHFKTTDFFGKYKSPFTVFKAWL